MMIWLKGKMEKAHLGHDAGGTHKGVGPLMALAKVELIASMGGLENLVVGVKHMAPLPHLQDSMRGK
jgi:hypothetical protein